MDSSLKALTESATNVKHNVSFICTLIYTVFILYINDCACEQWRHR